MKWFLWSALIGPLFVALMCGCPREADDAAARSVKPPSQRELPPAEAEPAVDEAPPAEEPAAVEDEAAADDDAAEAEPEDAVAPEEEAPAEEEADQAIALRGEPYKGPTALIEELRPQLKEIWKVKFETTFGDFTLEVYPELAPIHAVRFLELVRDGYYNNLHVHRIAPGWVVQWGDLYDRTTSPGRPAVYPQYEERSALQVDLLDEPVRFSNTQWTVSFAKGGPNTASTQPFVNLGDNSKLDSYPQTSFSPFAYVVEGRQSIEGLVEAFTPVMEKCQAALRAELQDQGAPESVIEQQVLNDLAWGKFVPMYWDPFESAFIKQASIIQRL